MLKYEIVNALIVHLRSWREGSPYLQKVAQRKFVFAEFPEMERFP